MDVPINLGLLVWECSYSNPRYDIIDAFADVADGRFRVCVDVVVLEQAPLRSAEAVP